MNGGISEETVRDALGTVKHPAIDRTLVELGIVKDVSVSGNKVGIVMAFPFANIPIGDFLVSSVKEPLEKLGAEVEVRVTVMDEGERQRFLDLEREGWKGGM